MELCTRKFESFGTWIKLNQIVRSCINIMEPRNCLQRFT